jgi:hypothetical protein
MGANLFQLMRLNHCAYTPGHAASMQRADDAINTDWVERREEAAKLQIATGAGAELMCSS